MCLSCGYASHCLCLDLAGPPQTISSSRFSEASSFLSRSHSRGHGEKLTWQSEWTVAGSSCRDGSQKYLARPQSMMRWDPSVCSHDQPSSIVAIDLGWSVFLLRLFGGFKGNPKAKSRFWGFPNVNRHPRRPLHALSGHSRRIEARYSPRLEVRSFFFEPQRAAGILT